MPPFHTGFDCEQCKKSCDVNVSVLTWNAVELRSMNGANPSYDLLRFSETPTLCSVDCAKAWLMKRIEEFSEESYLAQFKEHVEGQRKKKE